MSQPKVSRIENGKAPYDLGEVARFARAVGADDTLVNQLIARAESTHDRPTEWRPTPRSLAGAQHDIRQRETQARLLRGFEPTIIHGLLQTGEYARALLSAFQLREQIIEGDPGRPAASVAEALSARFKRQEVLADSGKSFVFVLLEAALENTFCPPTAMLGQINRIREVSQLLDNVSIRIIPTGSRMTIPPLHGFELFDRATVIVDTFNTALVSSSRANVKFYERIFQSFESDSQEDIGDVLERHERRYTRQLLSEHP
jgi:hypothetical protein